MQLASKRKAKGAKQLGERATNNNAHKQTACSNPLNPGAESSRNNWSKPIISFSECRTICFGDWLKRTKNHSKTKTHVYSKQCMNSWIFRKIQMFFTRFCSWKGVYCAAKWTKIQVRYETPEKANPGTPACWNNKCMLELFPLRKKNARLFCHVWGFITKKLLKMSKNRKYPTILDIPPTLTCHSYNYALREKASASSTSRR